MRKNLFAFIVCGLSFINLSNANDCQIALSISGPMEAYEREVVEILSRRNYEVKILRTLEDVRKVKHPSWIGLTSAGSMQFKQWQRIQLKTTTGMEIADESIEVGLFSNKERAVLNYLKQVNDCM